MIACSEDFCFTFLRCYHVLSLFIIVSVAQCNDAVFIIASVYHSTISKNVKETVIAQWRLVTMNPPGRQDTNSMKPAEEIHLVHPYFEKCSTCTLCK